MKRTSILLASLAAAITVATPMAANATPYQSINSRQDNLYQRIHQGVLNGSLTRQEAKKLQINYRQLVRLEANYRSSNGLSLRERNDLQRRYDRLSKAVRLQRHDNQDRYNRR